MSDVCYQDYETYYDDECSVKALGPRAYVEHPKFDAYLVSIICQGDEFVGNPRDFKYWGDIMNLDQAAHNAQFDREVYNWLVRKKIVPAKYACRRPWYCSASVAAYVGAPRGLAPAVKALYGHELDKGMRTWMKGKTWDDAVAAGKAERLMKYGLEDSRWGKRIFDAHFDQLPDWEKWLMEWTINSGMTGARVDVKYINQAQKTLLKSRQASEDKIPWVHEGDKPGSKPGLARWCRKFGIEPPASIAEDSPILEEWIEKNPDIPWVASMKEYASINRVAQLLETMKRRRFNDDEFSWSKKFYGAHTGRWSGDGGFNMENLPKEPKHGVDVRGCFIARKGKKYVVADLSQIEARVLVWLAGDKKTLALIAEGHNVYESHARATMNWRGEWGTMKKGEPELYALAKARVLGLGFGCGWKKFIDAAKTMAGLTIDAQTSKRTVNAYRATNPKVVALWKKLDLAFRRACAASQKVFEIPLPSGRSLKYFNCMMRGGRCMAQAVMGAPHKDWWGSKLVENYVQAVARDVIAEAVMRLEKAGIPVLFTVHDEVVCEVLKNFNVKRVVELVEALSPWMEGLPVGCEAVESERYLK